jgi:serine protease Do
MGVQLDDLNRQLGEYFGVEDGKGALVTEVVEDSPAAKAGLKAGDVIVKAGGKDVDASASLREALSDTEPGQQMDIKVVRKGKSKDLSVTLGEMPADDFAKQIKVFRDRDDRFSIPRAPRMMKRLGNHGDRAQSELKEMREELDKMREELQAMKKELKK